MIRTLVVVALGLCSVVAHADDAKAKKLYDAGESAYNLGDWEKAVELFRQAYQESPEPAFLFNIAQTYRQAGNCKQSVFFYKRFLALKANDTKKPLKPELAQEVEKRIGELEECVKREIANKPPDQLDSGSTTNRPNPTPTPPTNRQNTAANQTKPNPTKPNPTKPNPTTAQNTNDEGTDKGDKGDEEEETPEKPPGTNELPKLISVRGTAGIGKLSAGDLATQFQFAATILGGYPLALGDKLELDLGAAFSFSPVPYTTTGGEAGSLGLIGILANVGPSYTVIHKLAARADVGAGLLVASGLEKMGNPFTTGGAPATGALSSFMLRIALSADYAITPNVIVTVTPIAFSYSPAPSGFQPMITSLTTLSFMAGIGYRR